MNYVRDLRALVGTRPLILVGAGVLIVNERQELLLQRRTDDGLWGIPGGGLEPGESTEDAARREAREETGLIVGAMTLFGVFSGRELHHVYPNGDEAFIVSVVYRSRDVSSELRAGADETLELRYFSASELPAVSLVAPNKPIVAQFLQTHF